MEKWGNRNPHTWAGGSECAGLEEPAREVGFDSPPTQKEHMLSISLVSRDLPWRISARVDKEAQASVFPTVLLEIEGTGLQSRGPPRAQAPPTGWPSHVVVNYAVMKILRQGS